MTIDELIAALESVSGYDAHFRAEEFNEAIADEIWGNPVPLRTSAGRILHWKNGGAYYANAPNFVGSLDAALTLVPKGWDWGTGIIYRDHLDKPIIYAEVADARDGVVSIEKGYCQVENAAATAPLALCIAALRARKAGGQKP